MLIPLISFAQGLPPPPIVIPPAMLSLPRVAYVSWVSGGWWARFGDDDDDVKGTSPQTLRAAGYKVIIEE